MEIELDSEIPFLDVLVVRKGWQWPPNFIEDPPALAAISVSNLIIHHMSKDE
jgi:hypothetical protein